MGRFKPAVRTQSRLRMAIDGPPGAGKTWSALAFAFRLAELVEPDANRRRVAVIDTERGSASKYQGERPGGKDSPPWDFDVLELTTFSPTEYTSAANEASREGYTVLVIDSLSHAWAGKDGALEIKDKQGGNGFTAWKNVTPMHNAMVDSILQSSCHVIVTMRSKVEHILEINEQGKQVPRRVGMAPVQRAGMEYEFDLYGSMDWSHILTVSKSRCSAVADAVVVKPRGEWIDPVAQWLTTGKVDASGSQIVRQRVSDEQLRRLVALVHHLGWSDDKLLATLTKQFGVGELADLRPRQADDMLTRLGREVESRQESLREETRTTEQQADAVFGGNGVRKSEAEDEGRSQANTTGVSKKG